MPNYWTYGQGATGTSLTWYPTQANTTMMTPTWYSTNVTTTDQVWQTWMNTPSITTTGSAVYTYADEVWQQWVNVPSITMNGYQTVQQHTPEQIREANERYAAERQRLHSERQAARARARILLGEFLTDEQKTELERHGRFHVTGSRGRRYCIRTEGQSGNVDLLTDKGQVQASLCAHPRGYLPDGDAWLMQMLEIRQDEDHFLRTANVHRGRLPAGAR